jgi:hypothetical protein
MRASFDRSLLLPILAGIDTTWSAISGVSAPPVDPGPSDEAVAA